MDYADEEQQRRWFPGVVTGDLYTAISLTEPDTGSDVAAVTTSARRDGDDYVLNGAKTFVAGGFHADLIIVLARTAPAADDRRRGLSLIVVEADMPGLSKGPLMEKLGLKTQDTVELSFSDVRVPARNLLGEEGPGVLLPRPQPRPGAARAVGRKCQPGAGRDRADGRTCVQAPGRRNSAEPSPEHALRAGDGRDGGRRGAGARRSRA
jgi:acyl-CoA dehydrogenase